METIMHDIRQALRGLRHAPGFALVAVAILALGIGANTAIFSVVNAALLRSLPYADPDELVTVQHHYPGLDLQAPVSVPGFHDYRDRTGVFERAAVEAGWAPNLTGEGEPERLNGRLVSGDYFEVYGVAAKLGRVLRPDEAEAGSNKVVVLSHGFWQRRFAGDSGMVGRTIQLNGESYEVAGVMPATFRDFWSWRVELWSPLVFRPDQLSRQNATNEWLAFTGRLREGMTVAQARSDMHAFAERLKSDYPDDYPRNWDLLATPLAEQATSGVRTALYVLLGAVGFVLLIACANVANLQLARATARARDLAVRVALGASPRRLIRHMLTESVLIALIGGALGVLLAIWGVPALLALNNASLPPASEIGVDGPVLVFTLGVSLLTGLVFGILPALRVARSDLQDVLKEGGRGAAGDRAGMATRRALVVATMALALTLVAGAGLMIRSFGRLLGVDPGFDPERLLTFNVSLPAAKYPNDTLRIAGLGRIIDNVAAVPGVVSAGGTGNMPFGGSWSTGSFSVEGFQPPEGAPGPWGDQRLVTTGFLPTLGVRLVAGRHFTDADGLDSRRVAIVDEGMVRRFWPGQDPIGKRITYDDPADSNAAWIEVVGVVEHTLHEGLDGERRVQLYRPLAQRALPFLSIAVRTRGEPASVESAVRAAVHSVDADLPISGVATMRELIERSTGPRRFSMLLLSGFASLALLLASIGLYGVMSFSVTQRRQELGVRIALGAGMPSLLGLVLWQGMRLALVGVAIGLAAAFAGTRVMGSMLFQVGATDPPTFLITPVLLVCVAMLATYIPARRAAKLDPIEALRYE